MSDIDSKLIIDRCKEEGYLLKNVKTWSSWEGGGYQVTLYKGKTKVAVYYDEGNGGMVDRYETFNKELAEDFEGRFCKSLPQWFCYDTYIDTDYEIVVGEMLNEYENTKREARLLKTHVIATLPDGKEYQWKITPVHTRERLTAYIISKGGTNIKGGA